MTEFPPDIIQRVRETFHSIPQLSHDDHALLVVGIGSGLLLDTILDHYQLSSPQSPSVHDAVDDPFAAMPQRLLPVWVYEPDTELATCIQAQFDWTKAARHGQLRFFIGSEALEHLEEALLDPWTAAITHFAVSPDTTINPPIIQQLQSLVQTKTVERLQRKRQWTDTWKDTHECRGLLRSPAPSAIAWRDKYAEGRPLNVLAIGNLFTLFVRHSTAFLAQGFEQLGHKSVVLEERDPSQRMGPDAIQQAINTLHPDLVIAVNYNRQSFERVGCSLAGIPFLCWIQDPPMLDTLRQPESLAQRTELDFYVSAIKEIAREGQQLGYGPIPIVNVPTNPDVFQPGESTEADWKRYGSQVSYISTMAPETIDYVFQSERGDPNERWLRGLFRETYRFLEHRLTRGEPLPTPKQYQQIVQQCLGQIAPTPYDPHQVEHYAHILEARPARLALRALPVQWLLEDGCNVGLYGAGWDEHPVLGKHQRGIIPYGEPLASMLRASQLHLCIHGVFTMSMKVLDAYASGVLPIVRWIDPARDTEPIQDWFQEDRDAVLFRNRDDLLDKVRFYLQHPEERRAIAMRGREIVLQHFTYRHAAEKILQSIRARILGG